MYRVPFTTQDENGAFVGPFPVLLRFPHLARPIKLKAGLRVESGGGAGPARAADASEPGGDHRVRDRRAGRVR
ncbi:hypothetical protein [Actinosynnema sp. ALI-1.44]|uniref:hypothetical protein n=1 Tax=Actinosynnema sp. ALI-1.44 TaxID=1933779 RepID=UPI001177C19E|nr:hypothetical protein [Actinosynnema sp. ALI-1.44]